MKKYRPKFQWVLNEKLIGDETVQCKLKSLINMEKLVIR